MNNVRRKQIDEEMKALSTVIEIFEHTKILMENIRDHTEEILNEEQMAYENMTEGLKNSDKGMTSEDAMEHLQNAIDLIDETDLFSELESELEQAKF